MNMPKITILYGALLILLGVISYFLSNRESATALIPAAFGILVLAMGMAALKEAARKHAMHAASLLSLIGFLGTMGGLKGIAVLLLGGDRERPLADASRAIMAILSLVFFLLCLRSFILARKARKDPSSPGNSGAAG
jgi:uncharacterized membrane protein HdeD (DUF308 family)